MSKDGEKLFEIKVTIQITNREHRDDSIKRNSLWSHIKFSGEEIAYSCRKSFVYARLW